MAEPAVSVVIDNYNYGRFLKQCLESVLGQDYPGSRLEIILVDDGSTDDSLSVAALFKNHIKLITQRNGGQAAAFNAGVAAAAGELVMFLDSDDYWDRDKVRLVAACASDAKAGIVQHPLVDVDVEGRALDTVMPRWPARYSLDDFLAGGAALAAASGLAVRKDVLDKIGPVPHDVRYASDIYLIVHGLFFADAVNFPQAKGYHRIHGKNNWAGNYTDSRKLRMGLEIQRAFDGYLATRLKDRRLELAPRYVFLDELDRKRREVLLAVHEGRRGAALGLWWRLFRKHGFTRLGFFRSATLFLALVSPSLYLRAYDLYRSRHWLVRLRGRVLGG